MPRPIASSPEFDQSYARVALASGVEALAPKDPLDKRIRPLVMSNLALQLCHDYLFARGGGIVELPSFSTIEFTSWGGLVPHIRNPGDGYTSTPTLTASDPDWSIPGARRAMFTVVREGNRLGTVRVDDIGWGYTPERPRTIAVSGGGGAGAVVDAHIASLAWRLSDVGLRGNGSVLNDTNGVSGFALWILGRSSQINGSWDGRGPSLPFGDVTLRGPGYNNGAANKAQSNRRDGVLLAQCLGGIRTSSGAASNTVVRQFIVSGFRNNRVYGDSSYINHFTDSRSLAFWSTGDTLLSGADAGENYAFVNGVWANGVYTATGVNRVVLAGAGSSVTPYANPQVNIPAPTLPGGRQATATAYLNTNGTIAYVEMDDNGEGYDKTLVYQAGLPPGVIPVTITDAGGSGAGAVAFAVTFATAIYLPTGGNADVRLTNPSIDYCDQAALMFSGSLTGTVHTEGKSKFPFYHVGQGVNASGAEQVSLYLFGGDQAPTADAGDNTGRDCLVFVDNIHGGSNVSVVAPTRFNTFNYPTEVVRVANEAGLVKKLNLDGADINGGGANFAVPCRYLNQLANGKFNSTAGWDFGAPTGATFTANAGTGRTGNSGRLVCAAVNANGGTSVPRYVLRQFVPCVPGRTAFSEVYYKVTDRTAGYFSISVVYADVSFSSMPSGGRVLVNSTAGAVASIDWTRVGGANVAAPPGTRYACLVIDMSTYTGTLDLDDLYLFVQ